VWHCCMCVCGGAPEVDFLEVLDLWDCSNLVCTCVRERERLRACVCVSVCVCARVWTYVCLPDRRRERECVCLLERVCVNVCLCVCTYMYVTWRLEASHMGWLQLVGSIKLYVSFTKEPYKRDAILQKRPIILSILLTVATPYQMDETRHSYGWTMLQTWMRHVPQIIAHMSGSYVPYIIALLSHKSCPTDHCSYLWLICPI